MGRCRAHLPPLAALARQPEQCSALQHPVCIGGRQGHYQPLIVDHCLAVLVPVVVLAGYSAEVLDELVDGVVVGACGHWRQLNIGLNDDVRPEVVTIDVQAGPRIAAQVLGLRPPLGD